MIAHKPVYSSVTGNKRLSFQDQGDHIASSLRGLEVLQDGAGAGAAPAPEEAEPREDHQVVLNLEMVDDQLCAIWEDEDFMQTSGLGDLLDL